MMDPLVQRTLAAVWHPCTQMKHMEQAPPLAVAAGDGPWLIGTDGRRYLDLISSWWVNLFGHNEPRIKAAIKDQLDKIEHVLLAGCTHAPVVELSERLAALTGLGHAFYASDGASATEIALKMSAHYWRNVGRPQKNSFVSLANGYHGETVGALSVTDVALFKEQYAPLLRPSVSLPSPDFRLAEEDESATDYARRCAKALDEHLGRHADTTAALILEPLVQGAAGMAMYDPLYLELAREICDRHDVHLIADEIAVGFGRTGTMFACERAGITPDFMCLSKGITGGYLPLSCVLTRDNIYQAFYGDETARGFLHSHSYTGNPLACRAALAVLDIFAQDDVIAQNRAKAARCTELMAELAEHERVRHFRQLGMIGAFDVKDADVDFPLRFHRAALDRSMLLRPIGATVYFMPPYCIDETQMKRAVDACLQLLG